MNLYRNLPANDIIYTTSRNSLAFQIVYPLLIIAFWISLHWISIGNDAAHLCENPNDSILGLSLSQGISLGVLSFMGEEMIHAEFDATIAVLILEFYKTEI